MKCLKIFLKIEEKIKIYIKSGFDINDARMILFINYNNKKK